MHTDHTSSQRQQPNKDLQKIAFPKTPKIITNDEADFAYDDNDNDDVKLLFFFQATCALSSPRE